MENNRRATILKQTKVQDLYIFSRHLVLRFHSSHCGCIYDFCDEQMKNSPAANFSVELASFFLYGSAKQT